MVKKFQQNFLSYFLIIGIAVTAIFSFGCGASRPGMRKFHGVRVPPGVEPLIAVRADSLANQLFVENKTEAKSDELVATAQAYLSTSDSLWAVLDRAAEAAAQPSPADTAQALQETIAGYQEFQKAVPLIQEYSKSQNTKIKNQATYHLQEAEKRLVKALELNPYSETARRLLAASYKQLGDRFIDKTNYDRAIEIWERLIRLEPGEYVNYYKLGESYFAKQNWEKALENFEICEKKLRASADINDRRINDPSISVAAAIDSGALFGSVYYQAQSAIKLYDEEKAVAGLDSALALATTPQNRAAVESYIRWIEWDNNNIQASVDRDTAANLVGRGEFKKAAEVYARMIPKLRTDRARYETEWNLARLEYSQLDNKPAAVERLMAVVNSIPVDAETGVPEDSTNQIYIDTYGTMCHNLGSEYLKKDRKLAFTYFMQSSSVTWKDQGKSCLAMAELAAANPKEAIKAAEKAYELVHQLSPSERVKLHKLMITGYRRLNDFEKARDHFNKLKALQQGASNGPSNR